ncbi:hypothetical protein EJ110_NYTH52417 [Nymphaea thermarum]|nr:hypothetical protein EJ110_NYTH52417 [Nymphaea thermarum]
MPKESGSDWGQILEEVDKVQKKLENYKKTWLKTSCIIMADGRRRRCRFLNVVEDFGASVEDSIGSFPWSSPIRASSSSFSSSSFPTSSNPFPSSTSVSSFSGLPAGRQDALLRQYRRSSGNCRHDLRLEQKASGCRKSEDGGGDLRRRGGGEPPAVER